MIGTQSEKLLDQYKKQGGEFDQVLIGKKKTLQEYLDKYLTPTSSRKENHYITRKLFKYLKLTFLSHKYLEQHTIEEMIHQTLIT